MQKRRFYSVKTLCTLADHYGLHLHTNGINMHLFTKNKIQRMQFLRTIHSGVLRRLHIKAAVKSSCRVDYKEIVQRKNASAAKT
jgi:hypothetical protein